MSSTHSHDHQLPSALKEGDSMPETDPPFDSTSGQQAAYNSLSLCDMGAQSSHQGQFSSTYGLTPITFSSHQAPSPGTSEHEQAHMDYQPHRTQVVEGEQSEHTMAKMENLQGATSYYPLSYLNTMNTGMRYDSSLPEFSLAGSSASQEPAGILHASMTPPGDAPTVPFNGETGTFTSAQGRRKSAWTERHTEVLRQGKQAGKSSSDIVKDLHKIDGVERTPNMVSKRWARIRGGCIKKHEMDSILDAVCPTMVKMVYDELSKLDLDRMLSFKDQLAATERRVKGILRQFIAKGVQEVILKLFSDNVSRSE